jgi:hypothetical protein
MPEYLLLKAVAPTSAAGVSATDATGTELAMPITGVVRHADPNAGDAGVAAIITARGTAHAVPE